MGSDPEVPAEVPEVLRSPLVTAQTHGAAFWTQDADFDGIEGVKYVPRKAPG